MNYKDDFSAGFSDENDFLSFLDSIEEHAQWQVHESNTIHVIAAEENPDMCEQIQADEDKEDIIKDTCANTGLLLKIEDQYYPVGATTIKTLENRARISGTALQDLKKPKLARILNDCLQVSKGKSLLRIHEGKVRAIHSGGKSDYSVLPMPQLFEISSIHVQEKYDEARFSGANFEHSLTTASWEVRDERLFDTYRGLLIQYGMEADEALSAMIRVHTSDVGVSGANIFYSLLVGAEKKPLLLGNALKLEHENHASLENFSGNMEQVFARYREAIEGLGKLFLVYVNYPANVMAAVMNKAGIGKKLIAQTVEQFKVVHEQGTCNGYEVYCGICEAIFLGQSSGMGAKALVDLEEKVSRCLTFRFHEYDIPGAVSY